MTPNSSELRKHLASLGHKGGKARLTKMTSEQRREVARNAAQVRWSKQRTLPVQESESDQESLLMDKIFPSRLPPVYPQIVKDPPLRVRLVAEALRELGFKIRNLARQHGNHVFVVCFAPNEDAPSIENTCELISRRLRQTGILVTSQEIRRFQFGRELLVPVRISGPGTATDFVHSPDYHTIEYAGRLYTVTDRAAEIIRVLHQAHTAGTPSVGAITIRRQVRMSSSQRIDHAFRKQDGPQAWKDLIVSDRTRRLYRLNLPDIF